MPYFKRLVLTLFVLTITSPAISYAKNQEYNHKNVKEYVEWHKKHSAKKYKQLKKSLAVHLGPRPF